MLKMGRHLIPVFKCQTTITPNVDLTSHPNRQTMRGELSSLDKQVTATQKAANSIELRKHFDPKKENEEELESDATSLRF